MGITSIFSKQICKIEQILFFWVILLIPTQLGKHFWPEFSYIYSLRIDYYSPVLYLWDLGLFGLLLCWVFSKPKINGLVVSLGLIFLMSQILSLGFSGKNLGAGLVRLEQYFLGILFVIYISSKNWDFLKDSLMKGLMIGVIYTSIIGIGQFLWGRSLGFWILGERDFSISSLSIATFNFEGQIFLRPYSVFSHPNVLAAFLILSLALILGFEKPRKRIWEEIYKISIVMSILTSLLSFSRAAILGLFFEGGLFLRRKVLVLLLFLVVPIVYVRFWSAFDFDSLSVLRREELAVISINQFLNFPIFGVGLNNFIIEVSKSDLISGPSRFLQPVHNIFLLTLAETGILGLLGFLGILGLAIKKVYQRKEERFKKSLLISWGIIIFLGMFDHYFLTLPQGQRMLFLVWGLSFVER